MVHVVRLIHDRTGWFATMDDDEPPAFPAHIHWSFEFTERELAASVLGVADLVARCFNSATTRARDSCPCATPWGSGPRI